MRTLLAFSKAILEDPQVQNLSPIGEDLREMLSGFHSELLRHSNHPGPQEEEGAGVEDAAAANAKQVKLYARRSETEAKELRNTFETVSKLF